MQIESRFNEIYLALLIEFIERVKLRECITLITQISRKSEVLRVKVRLLWD
jgi:hypothetical protein